VHDPVGDAVGVGVAELLAAAGHPVAIVAPDRVVGARLSRTGDLAPANTRLQRAAVDRRTTTLLRSVGPGSAVLADRWTGQLEEVPCAVVVDCGHRLPEDSLHGDGVVPAGDTVAPRTVLEAVLEGRRAALALSRAAEVDRAPVPALRRLPALDSLQLSRPWYLRGPAAWHPRTGRPAAAAPDGAPTV
jgi:2,4-dienoyl-CoA reductase (NADPH2)